jgi:hypothetical protein
MILYVNGEVRAERAASGKIATSSDALYIGNKNDSLVDGFIGQIDEVRIWEQVRYPVEIVRDMHLWTRGDEGGLRAYWRFDQPGKSSFLDSSKNAYHGQPVGPISQVKGSSPASWVMWQVGDGVLVPGEEQTIYLALFPATLPPGSYAAGIYAADAVLHSNDPQRAAVRVPVSMSISAPLILNQLLYLPAVRR